MTPGLDPALFDGADQYRHSAENPAPRLDGLAMQRLATNEASLLFKQAAEVLTRAGVPKVAFYEPKLFGVHYRGEGWYLGEILLTATGVAHAGGTWNEMRHQPPAATRSYKAAQRHSKRSGRAIHSLGEPLVVAQPRVLVDGNDLLSATADGRVEIFYNTYERYWMLLDEWLNNKLRQMLRP